MELSKNFEPSPAEEKWTQHWKIKKYFLSVPDQRLPFTVVIPPPNVTGVLHMGHTLNETVQDILVRYARMNGFNACWVPGSDHASIATEAKVVQMLEKEKGIKKKDLTREKFLEYAFEWKEKYGGIIYKQIEKLGCSVDWDRVTFTMDAHYYKAVIKVFIDLYNKGLIYRGARMINWDPAAKTALSDEEVEYRETQGKLYYIRYLVDDNSSVGLPSSKTDHIVIATQRPETIMGDTGVAVNPSDERYSHLKGRRVIIPLVNRSVPLIFDDYVDKEFGTGALKVTPAHDLNDYNLGLKHHLETIDTLNEDGTLSNAAQVFVGLDRFEARKKVIEQLKEQGLLIKEEDYATRLGFSQRTNAVVEPRISTQWFVKMKELAKPALLAVTKGEIKIHPGEKFLATYKYWLENVKDWCISRQLWWGQRIPAWYSEDGKMVVAEDAIQAARLKLHEEGKSDPSALQLEACSGKQQQDEDVLDTWFSSWLWPMEVFKGITDPGNKDINYYYPTSVLVTGQDIIFFWVARMIMAGMEFKQIKPFEHVYFTGMVRDKQGRKMSKQLGNSPDLLDLIDQYGADAVRFGIMISSPAGNDLLFDENSCEQGRNFNNKIWNALKLVKIWQERQSASSSPSENSFAVEWFENRLNQVKVEVDGLHKDFRLSEALKTIYSLIWDDYCSWYLEWVKPGYEQPIDPFIVQKSVAFFEELLQLLHPFMPFVTEEVYHQLNERKEGDDLTIRQMKMAAGSKANDQNTLTEIAKELIQKLRELRNKRGIRKDKEIHVLVADFPFLPEDLTRRLKIANAYCSPILHNATPSKMELLLIGSYKFFIDLNEFDSGIDEVKNNTKRKQELLEELTYFKGFLASVDKKLNNQRFVQNAKPDVVETEKKKRADAEAKIKAIEESLANL